MPVQPIVSLLHSQPFVSIIFEMENTCGPSGTFKWLLSSRLSTTAAFDDYKRIELDGLKRETTTDISTTVPVNKPNKSSDIQLNMCIDPKALTAWMVQWIVKHPVASKHTSPLFKGLGHVSEGDTTQTRLNFLKPRRPSVWRVKGSKIIHNSEQQWTLSCHPLRTGFVNESVPAACKVITLWYTLKAILCTNQCVSGERQFSWKHSKFNSLIQVDIGADFFFLCNRPLLGKYVLARKHILTLSYGWFDVFVTTASNLWEILHLLTKLFKKDKRENERKHITVACNPDRQALTLVLIANSDTHPRVSSRRLPHASSNTLSYQGKSCRVIKIMPRKTLLIQAICCRFLAPGRGIA